MHASLFVCRNKVSLAWAAILPDDTTVTLIALSSWDYTLFFFTWAISWDLSYVLTAITSRWFWTEGHISRRTMMITAGEGGENREWYPWDTRSSNFIKQGLCLIQNADLLRCGIIPVKKQFFSGAAIPRLERRETHR